MIKGNNDKTKLETILTFLWPRKLNFQLALFVSSLLVFSMFCFSLLNLDDEIENISSYMTIQANVLAKNISATSADHLLRRDYTSIEQLLFRSAEFPGILNIQLSDNRGVLLGDVIKTKNNNIEARYGMPSLKTPIYKRSLQTIADNMITIWQPIILGETLGWVKITYSLDHIKSTQARVIRNNIIIGLIIVPLTILVLISYLRRLTESVERYTDFANNLDDIKGKHVLINRNSLELEHLGNALNFASNNLYEQSKAIESAMSELERLAAFPEMNPNIVLSMDNKGNTLYLNPYGKKLLQDLNLLENDFKELLPPNYISVITRCLADNRTEHAIESTYKNRIFLWTIAPVVKLNIAHGHAIEITQRIEAKKLIQTAQIEKAAAEAANVAKSTFLANMSHEIRTPLTAIIGFSETLLDNSQNEEEKTESINTVIRSGKHLRQIINDILDLSKIEAEKLEIEYIDISPFALLDDIHSFISLLAQEKGLEFDIEYSYPIPSVINTDPVRLKQIIINLCTNAIKFTKTGEVRIKVSFSFVKEIFTLKVIDTGIGLTAEQIKRVFKPFAQADSSTTRKFGGTGLGLFLSKQLAEKLGGDICIESSPKKGSCFTATVGSGHIDESKLLYQRPEPEQITSHDSINSQNTRYTGKILLTEDNKDNQRLISMYLNKLGAEVIIANNGKEAIEKTVDETFDLILMDIQMPIMNGLDATMQLRQSGYTRPIVALTANAMKEDVISCYQAGCDDFIQKPIVKHKFMNVVKSHLKEEIVANDESTAIISTLSEMDPGMKSLVEGFVFRLAEYLENIRTNYKNKQWSELREVTHALKGASGNYGFDDLYQLMQKIEAGLLKEDYQQIDAHIQCLDGIYQRITQGISKG